MHTHNISLLTSERYAQLMFAHNIKLTSLMLLLQHVIQDSVLTKNFVDMIFYKIFLDIKKILTGIVIFLFILGAVVPDIPSGTIITEILHFIYDSY